MSRSTYASDHSASSYFQESGPEGYQALRRNRFQQLGPLHSQGHIRLQPASVCKSSQCTGWARMLLHTVLNNTKQRTPILAVFCAVQIQKQNLLDVSDVCAIVHPTSPLLDMKGRVSSAIAAAFRPYDLRANCSRLLLNSSGSIKRGEAKISTLPRIVQDASTVSMLFMQCCLYALVSLTTHHFCRCQKCVIHMY